MLVSTVEFSSEDPCPARVFKKYFYLNFSGIMSPRTSSKIVYWLKELNEWYRLGLLTLELLTRRVKSLAGIVF